MSLINHGDERKQPHTVNHGTTKYFKREKFCIIHGWIDLFFVDELSWFRQHFKCDKNEAAGAVSQGSQVMEKAA